MVNENQQQQQQNMNKQIKNMYCNVEIGHEPCKLLMNPISKTGHCFFCDSPYHSQTYCPIRQCHVCQGYGHGYKICKLIQRGKNDHTTKKKSYSKNEKYKHHKSYAFGSSWNVGHKLIYNHNIDNINWRLDSSSSDSCGRSSLSSLSNTSNLGSSHSNKLIIECD